MPFDPNRLLKTISGNIAALRRARKWSQQELAERSKVSLRMIGLIESGQSNVSLAKLGNIAAAFDLTFSELVQERAAGEAPTTGRPVRGTQLWQGLRPGTKVDLLQSFPASRTMELWRWAIAAGDRYQGEPDLPGYTEVVYVLQGQLTFEQEGASQVLRAGDSFSFPSDHPYAFINTGRGALRFMVNVVA
jgi:transcriptional regulator with XRE-family HTH domain